MARIAPGDVDEARRARGGTADRVDEREVLLEQIVADHRTHRCAVVARKRARGLFELGRAHVVGGCVDEIAREADPIDDAGEILTVGIAGQFQLDLLLLLLAVAHEAVAAESEGERRELRIVRRVGEAIGTGREQAGQRPWPEQVFAGLIGGLEGEQHAGERTVACRHQQVPAGLGLEARGVGEGALARIEALAQVAPGRRVYEGYRDGRAGLAARKEDWMHGRTARGAPAGDFPATGCPTLALTRDPVRRGKRIKRKDFSAISDSNGTPGALARSAAAVKAKVANGKARQSGAAR